MAKRNRKKRFNIESAKLKRLDWDEMFMNISLVAANRTSCIYHKVGSVFVDDFHRIISIGYNGPCAGDVHCIDMGCAKIHGDPITGEIKPCRGVHSEINAISNCQDVGRLRGSTLYVTVHPCYRCMKSLVNVGVKKIIYLHDFRKIIPGSGDKLKTEIEPEAAELAKRSNILVEKYNPEYKNIAEIKFK